MEQHSVSVPHHIVDWANIAETVLGLALLRMALCRRLVAMLEKWLQATSDSDEQSSAQVPFAYTLVCASIFRTAMLSGSECGECGPFGVCPLRMWSKIANWMLKKIWWVAPYSLPHADAAYIVLRSTGEKADPPFVC